MAGKNSRVFFFPLYLVAISLLGNKMRALKKFVRGKLTLTFGPFCDIATLLPELLVGNIFDRKVDHQLLFTMSKATGHDTTPTTKATSVAPSGATPAPTKPGTLAVQSKAPDNASGVADVKAGSLMPSGAAGPKATLSTQSKADPATAKSNEQLAAPKSTLAAPKGTVAPSSGVSPGPGSRSVAESKK